MPVKRTSATRDRDEDRGRGRRRDEDDDRYSYDDDEDDRPRSRRRRDDDDDDREEDRPRRSQSRSRDDEEEDNRPRSRSRDRDAEDEDDRPRRSSRSRDEDEDEDRPRRSSSRDDDRGRGERSTSGVHEGWEGAHKVRDQGGDFANSFKIEGDNKYVVKFLDDGPYASYRQHWLDGRQGKKSFVCPEDPDDDRSPRCPLCDAGDTTRRQFAFNIAVIPEEGKPRVMSWEVGIRLQQKLEKLHKDPKIGPLSNPYFAVSRSGKGTNADTQVTPIKARDLYDDFGVDELTDRELETLERKRYTKSVIEIPSKSTLRQLADELTKYD